MIDRTLGWLTGASSEHARNAADELELALAALLVEAAYNHDQIDERERGVIAHLLVKRFGLSAIDRAGIACHHGKREADRAAELFQITQIVKDGLSFRQRLARLPPPACERGRGGVESCIC